MYYISLTLVWLSTLILVFVSIYAISKRIISNYSLLRQNKVLSDNLKYYKALRSSENEGYYASMERVKTYVVYQKLKKAIKDENNTRNFGESDWDDLIDIVDKEFLGFSCRLQNIQPLSIFELKVCVLLKLGISSKDISNLTYHDLSSVSTARRRLFMKFFDKKKGSAKQWDEFIRKF